MEQIGRLPSVTKKIDDESTPRQFQFVCYCDCCGSKYRMDTIPFSVTGAPEDFKDFTPAQKMIWDTEHEDAYERTNQSAIMTFEVCAKCGKRVCEICMDVPVDYDLCPDCRAEKKNNQSFREE